MFALDEGVSGRFPFNVGGVGGFRYQHAIYVEEVGQHFLSDGGAGHVFELVFNHRVLLQLAEYLIAEHQRVGLKAGGGQNGNLASFYICGWVTAACEVRPHREVGAANNIRAPLGGGEVVGSPQPFAAYQQALGHKLGGFAVQIQVRICVGAQLVRYVLVEGVGHGVVGVAVVQVVPRTSRLRTSSASRRLVAEPIIFGVHRVDVTLFINRHDREYLVSNEVRLILHVGDADVGKRPIDMNLV